MACRKRVAWILALACVCVLPLPVYADGDDAQDFEEALERLHAARNARRYDRALKGLKKLLAAHERKPYVRGYRAELEDLAERLAFGAKYPAPEPGDVVRGKIAKYNPTTGSLKIEYTSKGLRDFEQAGRHTLFPARIRGPFLVEISGNRYPGSSIVTPEVMFGGQKNEDGDSEFWRVVFGKEGVSAQILHSRGRSRSTISKRKPFPGQVGKPYVLKAKFSKNKITGSLNGKTIGPAKWRGDFRGWLSTSSFGWLKFVFTGTVEPAWIQTRLDRHVQKQQKEFRKGYNRRQVLPAWLFEGKTADGAKPPPNLPVPLAKKHTRTYEKYEAQLAKPDFAGALNSVSQLMTAGAAKSVCDYLRAYARYRQGEPAKGLEHIEQCLAKEPDFLVGAILRGRLLMRLGDPDRALDAFREAIAKHPNQGLGYEAAAIACLRMGRPRDARRFVADAAAGNAFSEGLDAISMTLVRTLHGPNWARSYEHKSANYHVVSDIDKKACQEASKLLEEALTAYRVQLHWVKKQDKVRFKVFLFNGQQGFASYLTGLNVGMRPPKWAAGVYSGTLKQLCIWNLPSKEAMRETIRHEGFHQYLDSLMHRPPVWFNEGLAVYHENSKRKRGRLTFGHLHPYNLKVLAEKGLVPLGEFVQRGPAQFYGDAERSYAQAWAFVHMLKTGTKTHRTLFKRLMKDLQEEEQSVVMARHFPPLALEALDEALREHVAKLRAQ